MKLASLSLALLACATSVSAQYFSDGWAPGKPVTEEPPAATPRAGRAPAQQPAKGMSFDLKNFDLTKVLESGPVSNLFGKIGVNISKQIEAARAKVDTWDPRIPLITDSNYDEVIVNEPLTEEEAEKRLWFVVM